MSATDEPEQHSSRSILFWATAIVVIAILLGLSYFSGTLSGSRSAANEATPTVPPTATIVPSPTPIIITEAGVLRRIESKQILQTTTFRIDTLVRAKKEGSWFFNWGGQNLLLFVKGTVTAGIDLSELKAEHVTVSQETKTIEIRLPQAKVLNANLDDYEIETYEGKPAGNVDAQLVKNALDEGRKQIATTACEDGILNRATDDARIAFERIISFVEFADYKTIVVTTPPSVCSFEVTQTP
jgi:hypothetical protein